MKVTDSLKHFSLLRYGINYRSKKFFDTGPSDSNLECLSLANFFGLSNFHLWILNCVGTNALAYFAGMLMKIKMVM